MKILNIATSYYVICFLPKYQALCQWSKNAQLNPADDDNIETLESLIFTTAAVPLPYYSC